MNLTINGAEYELSSPPLATLLFALREEVGITGPKAGCNQGGCGACTVLLEGEPVRACLMPLAAVDGASITTVEGLGQPERLSTVQAAFHQEYGSQCGFCTPGMITATHALLERTPSPTRSDIEEALSGHVCRCTGYVKIIQAVEAAARGEVAEESALPGLADAQPGQPDVVIPGSPA